MTHREPFTSLPYSRLHDLTKDLTERLYGKPCAVFVLIKEP